MNRNSVLLIGFTGHEPVCKEMSNGSKLTVIRVATHSWSTNKKGEKTNHTTWHTVVAWDKKAEYARNNFVKGSKIFVEGSIVYRSYLDASGRKQHATDIIAYKLMNLDR